MLATNQTQTINQRCASGLGSHRTQVVEAVTAITILCLEAHSQI